MERENEADPHFDGGYGSGQRCAANAISRKGKNGTFMALWIHDGSPGWE
jgi:hypothetical protein